MHLMFVEPSKATADIIVKAGDDWQAVIMAIKQLADR